MNTDGPPTTLAILTVTAVLLGATYLWKQQQLEQHEHRNVSHEAPSASVVKGSPSSRDASPNTTVATAIVPSSPPKLERRKSENYPPPHPRLLSPTSLPKVVLKNFEKWSKCPSHGKQISRFIPCKLFYDPPYPDSTVAVHTIDSVRKVYPNCKLIMDLQNGDYAYNVDMTAPSVLRHRMRLISKQFPSEEDIQEFNNKVKLFLSTDDGSGLIVVHCHYGFNRTGFQICSYLVEVEGMDVNDAISIFAESRPPGIKHAHFREELRRRYPPKGEGVGKVETGQ